MSEVYIKEPNTKGKAVLQTTHGDLEIEMWATEAPKACRNFCQLILEGYYNGTIFHRVIKDFIVQGGDKTNTGEGSESIYGEPYPDEIHPRLKFRYRGMMGIASAGKGTNTNGSQFFIVLDRAPSLDMKHTLFAKIVGQTTYNLVRINDVPVDKHDRPLDPPRVLRAELTWDPFGDLEPRSIPAPPSSGTKPAPEQFRRAPVRNKKVLSFGDEEEDSDDDEGRAPVAKKGGAHDLLDDPRLLKGQGALSGGGAAAKASGAGQASGASKRSATPAAAEPAQSAARGGKPDGKRAAAAKKPAPKEDSEVDYDNDDDDSEDESEDDVALEKSQKRQQEILKLKKEIVGMSSGSGAQGEGAKGNNKSALEELRSSYVSHGHVKPVGKEGRRREADVVQGKLSDFMSRLRKVSSSKDSDDARAEEKSGGKADTKKVSAPEEGTFAAIWQEGEEEGDEDWLDGGGLKFHVSGDKAFKLASDREGKRLEIFDPLAAKGNDEVLAEERKKRAKGMQQPQLRRRGEPDKKKSKTDGRGDRR